MQQQEKYIIQAGKGLVLRGSASKTGEPIQTVPEDAEIEILGEENGFYKVKVDGKEGYLYAEYVKVQEGATEKPEEAAKEETSEEPEEDEAEEEEDSVKVETKIHLLPSMASTAIGTIPADGEVKIIKTVGKWNYVSYENIKGWVRVNSQSQKVEEEEEEETEEEEKEEEKEEETANASEDTNVSFTKGYINSGSGVRIRKEPNKSSEVITTLSLNTGVTITAQTDEWFKVTYGDITGYIHKSLISDKETEVEEETTSTSTTSTSSRSSETRTAQDEEDEEDEVYTSSSSSSGTGSEIAAFAKQYLGYSYSYGGTSPSTGFDCSGFAQYVYSSFGYSLAGRGASSQAQSGTAVSRDDLEPGDLIAFSNGGGGSIGHVGIYIGDGMMVHAANPSRGVVTDTINSGYYNTYYYTARRIAD